MSSGLEKTKRLILILLHNDGPSTTEELITEAESLGIAECRDRLPGALAALNSEGKLTKKLSKEKKAIVWDLSDSVDRTGLDI